MPDDGMQVAEAGQFLTFDLLDERYALPVGSVEVVLEMPPITRVPRCPPYLKGVINHRGSVVPVVDLTEVFGIGRNADSTASSIIVTQIRYEDEKLVVGVLADSVQEVADLEAADIEHVPFVGSRIDGAFVTGICRRGKDFLIILNLENALCGAFGAGVLTRASVGN
jgi:chemotaxis signal transduction protein